LRVPAGSVDAAVFEQLFDRAAQAEQGQDLAKAAIFMRQALDLWRGEALSGALSATTEGFANALNERRAAAVERLATVLLRQRETQAALACIGRELGRHPLRESLRALQIRGLYLAGRQAEALAVYEDVRRLLADELGADPSQELRDLHQAILRGQVADVSPPGLARTAGESTDASLPYQSVTPSSLPRDVPEFTGRAEEVAKIYALLGGTTHQTDPVVVIEGMGGVGKTSLAVHIAHQLAPDYPDGQYFIDLNGFGPSQATTAPAEALSQLLRAAGVPSELVPLALPERIAMWRSHLAGKRAILLLDNARDAPQIKPLLPGGPDVLIIVTSRVKLSSLAGAVPIPLDALAQEDSIALFRRIVGVHRAAAEPDAVADAVRSCGYLPLAIQLAASRLRSRPSWSVNYLVEQLRDASDRARLLSDGEQNAFDVIAWSYQQLPEQAKKVMRLGAWHPGGDFDVAAAAALTGLQPPVTKTRLEELFEANLVEQPSPGRYRIHDLIRETCRRYSAKDTIAEIGRARRRLLDYYLSISRSCCALIAKGLVRTDDSLGALPDPELAIEDSGSAVSILDLEYQNIVGVMHMADEYGFSDYVWTYCDILSPYFSTLNFPDELEPSFEAALASARTSGNPRALVSAFTNLAMYAKVRSGYPLAHTRLLAALDAGQRLDDPEILGWILNEVALLETRGGDFAKAETYLRLALENAQAAGNLSLIVAISCNLGYFSLESGRFAEAIEIFEQTLRLDCVPTPTRFIILANLAVAHLLSGEPRSSLSLFQRSLEIAEEIGDRPAQAQIKAAYSNALRAVGDFAAALALVQEALEAGRNLGNYEIEGLALNALGNLYICTEEYGAADHVFSQALSQGEQINAARLKAHAHEGLAHVRMALGRTEQAREHLEAALAVSPGGVEDPEGAQRHLANLGGQPTSCWRCHTSR
jgi:tetratricopeptide (TPR) repeat protein